MQGATYTVVGYIGYEQYREHRFCAYLALNISRFKEIYLSDELSLGIFNWPNHRPNAFIASYPLIYPSSSLSYEWKISRACSISRLLNILTKEALENHKVKAENYIGWYRVRSFILFVRLISYIKNSKYHWLKTQSWLEILGYRLVYQQISRCFNIVV